MHEHIAELVSKYLKEYMELSFNPYVEEEKSVNQYEERGDTQ